MYKQVWCSYSVLAKTVRCNTESVTVPLPDPAQCLQLWHAPAMPSWPPGPRQTGVQGNRCESPPLDAHPPCSPHLLDHSSLWTRPLSSPLELACQKWQAFYPWDSYGSYLWEKTSFDSEHALSCPKHCLKSPPLKSDYQRQSKRPPLLIAISGDVLLRRLAFEDQFTETAVFGTILVNGLFASKNY